MENNEEQTSNLGNDEKLIDDSKLNENAPKLPDVSEGKITYFSSGSEESGKMEIDLVTFRERGAETRYIAIAFSGLNIKADPPVQQEAFFNIETEVEFNKLKDFISSLNWND